MTDCMNTVTDFTKVREAVCVNVRKIMDACRDQDCAENIPVYLTAESQQTLDSATSVKARSAELLYAGVEVEPLQYREGYYCVNTQYYYFENALHKEMAGVTNMIGYLAYASECVMTALIDTEGTNVDIVLPGGVRVGGQESDIYGAFPEFRGRALDGLAGFRGNELLYACNVRDDGCHGYVLIRNDAPFYSAVSIICDGGVIREISYECLGSERARGVFL